MFEFPTFRERPDLLERRERGCSDRRRANRSLSVVGAREGGLPDGIDGLLPLACDGGEEPISLSAVLAVVAPKARAEGASAEILKHKLGVENIEATVNRLRADGVQFRNDVQGGRGGKQILLDDPSGNPVELFQPASD